MGIIDQSFDDLDRSEKGFIALYMVILPGLLLLTYITAYIDAEEIITAIFCGSIAVVIYYITRHRLEASSHEAVALAISSITVSLFAAYVTLDLTEENVFEHFSPYLGALSAWAVPTIMWQEARWFAEHRQMNSKYSGAFIESIGFGVALLYTALYVLIDTYGREDDSAFAIFFGLLLVWVSARYFLFQMGKEQEP